MTLLSQESVVAAAALFLTSLLVTRGVYLTEDAAFTRQDGSSGPQAPVQLLSLSACLDGRAGFPPATQRWSQS